jgi:hypothetical protein
MINVHAPHTHHVIRVGGVPGCIPYLGLAWCTLIFLLLAWRILRIVVAERSRYSSAFHWTVIRVFV